MISRPRQAAALLVCLGAVLLLPPIALIFAREVQVLGVPLPVIYIFGMWLALILGAIVVTRVLPDTEGPE